MTLVKVRASGATLRGAGTAWGASRVSVCGRVVAKKTQLSTARPWEKKGWQAGIDQTEVFQSGLGKEVVAPRAASDGGGRAGRRGRTAVRWWKRGTATSTR